MPAAINDPKTGKFVKADAAAAQDDPLKKPPESEQDISGIMNFMEKGLDVDPKDRTPAPDKKAEAEKAKKEKEAAAAKIEADKKKLAARRAPAADAEPETKLTAADIARETGKAVAEALKAKPDDKKESKAPALPPAEARRVAILNQMEKLYPDRYKSIAEKYATSMLKLKEYAEKWKAEHPGEDYEAEAPEHKAFYDDNDVDWDDDDYTEALADLRAEAKLEAERKTTNSKLSELERKEKLRDAAPLIAATQNRTAKAFWKAFGEDYADLLDAEGRVNGEKFKALHDADPIGMDLRVQSARNLDVEMAELHKLANGLIAPQKDNPVHANLEAFALAKQDALLKAPKADRTDAEGRMFISREEYDKLKPAERDSKYWTFSAADLAALRAHDYAKAVTQRIEAEEARLKAYAESKGYKLGEKAAPAAAAVEEEVIEEDDKPPDNPPARQVSKLAARQNAAGNESKTGLDAFFERSLK